MNQPAQYSSLIRRCHTAGFMAIKIFSYRHEASTQRGLWAVCLSLFLSACASAPQVADKSVSQFNDRARAESPLVALATSQPH